MRERIPRALRGLLHGRAPGGLSRRTAPAHAAPAHAAPAHAEQAPAGQAPDQHDTDPQGIRILTPNGRD